MKKLKLFLITIFSLFLPSCSFPSASPSQTESNLNESTQKLGNFSNKDIFATENLDNIEPNKQNIQPLRFPVSSGKVSGEIKSITESPKDQNDKTIEAEKTPENINDTLITTTEKDDKTLLSTYSSKVYTKTADRQKNLRIVCEKLTGTILAPNEEFSYNTVCGPYNKEHGFGKATIFLGNGVEAQDYGGGVCQLSSTLYNAVKDLGVEITERHLHSKKVYYVPDGQDATVSYGNLDFKFKNLNSFSLYFEASSNAEQVVVNVYKI